MKKPILFTLFACYALLAEALIWNADNGFAGWTIGLNAKVQILNQNLTFTEIKFDCSVRNMNVNIDPQKYNTFIFRYRATGIGKHVGQFYFCHKDEKFSDTRKWQIPLLIADGQWHTATISPQNQTSWLKGGMIYSLRFDPTDDAGGTIEISEMRLEKQEKSASATAYVWDKNNSLKAWNNFKRCKGTYTGENIKLDTIGEDCSIILSPVKLDPLKVDSLVFRYRASGTGKNNGQFYFCHKNENFSDARRWIIPPLIADGQWHTIRISPVDLTSWQKGGSITSLRFDPTDAAGGTLEISEIRLEKKPAVTAPTEYVWNKNHSLKEWKRFRLCKGTNDGNIIKMEKIGDDCSVIISNIQIDPKVVDTFCFHYRANGIAASRGEVFYCHKNEPFSSKYFFPIPPLIADGQWHDAIIPIQDLKRWNENGIITGLRLDPTNDSGGTLEISEIKLIRRQTTKTNAKLEAPVWPKVHPEFTSEKKKIIPEHYFQGKMIRSPEDKFTGGKYHDFILCKIFSLKEEPIHAWLQFTADDCSEVFINGHSAGHSNDWKKISVNDVKKWLKSGKNVLTFHYINFNTFGGVIGELYLQYRNGTSERIHTDKTFLCGLTSQKDWNTATVDLTGWKTAIEQNAPPAAPWKVILPYHYFHQMQMVTKASLSHQKALAGETIKINLEGEGEIPTKSFPVKIALSTDTTVVWDEIIQISPTYFTSTGKRCWKATIPYTLPLYLNSNQLKLSLESDQLSCQDNKNSRLSFAFQRIHHDPHFPQKLVCKVSNFNGTTNFILNGKPFYPYWLATSRNPKVQAEFNVVTVYVQYDLLQPVPKQFNLHLLDQKAEEMRRRYPNAYFMWDISCFLPNTWGDLHASQMCRDEKGRLNKDGRTTHSYSSKVALEDLKQLVEATICHLEKSPYANRIMGYRITGGHTTEWLGWNSTTGAAIDFAPCAKKAFAEFAKAKYPDLKDHSIPTGDERKQLDGNSLLWDQQKHLKTIAYFDFVSNSVADTVITLCKHARKFIGNDKVIGTYYGYISTLHYTGRSQTRAHYALKKLLDSKTVDFIMSPQSYPLRYLGETCGDMKPFKTLQMHNIIAVCEDDSRTHYGPVADLPTQTLTEEQSIHILRRNMSIAVCRNNPAYHLPLTNRTELDFPAFPPIAKALRRLGQHCLDKGVKRHAEIALVCSEKTIKSMPLTGQINASSGIIDQSYRPDGSVIQNERIKPILTYETFIGNQDRFTRAGAPVDLLLAEDLKDNPGNYKLYVFMNCYKVDEAFCAAVKKLQQKKCVLLWLYAPGYIRGTQSNIINMKNLTGFSFEKLPQPELALLKMKDRRTMGTPSMQVKPLFAITNKNVEILGTYPNGKTGAATMKTGNALTIFSGAWQLDMPFINQVVKQAGIYRYVDTDDPVEANDSVMTIHARCPGKKQIRFPRKTNVLDVFNQKIIGRNVDRIDCDFKLHETRCFYYGDDAEVLLSELIK